MADTSTGFRFRGTRSGEPMHIQDLLFKDAEVLTKGDLVNLESGEVDLLATGDATAVGLVLEVGITGVDSTTRIKVAVNGDMILGVYDAVARLKGVGLDVAGATGAQTVASSSGNEFKVWAESTATEETLLCFNTAHHVDNVAV